VLFGKFQQYKLESGFQCSVCKARGLVFELKSCKGGFSFLRDGSGWWRENWVFFVEIKISGSCEGES